MSADVISGNFKRYQLGGLYDAIVESIHAFNDAQEPGSAISKPEVIGTLELVKQYFMLPEELHERS